MKNRLRHVGYETIATHVQDQQLMVGRRITGYNESMPHPEVSQRRFPPPLPLATAAISPAHAAGGVYFR